MSILGLLKDTRNHLRFRRNYIFEFCHRPYVSCHQLYVNFAFTFDLIVAVMVIVTDSDDGVNHQKPFLLHGSMYGKIVIDILGPC